MNIVCLKWGNKYNSDYINKLYAGIKRNTTLSFKFYCFTDNKSNINENIICHDLPYANNKSMKGWWQKLYLFSPDMPIKGKIFYIDLDTVIAGNIDDILSVEGFIVLRDFYASMARGVSTTDIGSGLMTWNTTNGLYHPEIWETFMQNPISNINQMHPHGDQRWIQKFVLDRKYWQDVLPGQVVSFKCHCVGGLPADARVICYHGKPSVPESIKSQSRGWRNIKIPASKWVGNHWHE